MMDNLGFLAALAAAVCWGTYIVPFKKSKSDKPLLFQGLMSVGILISGFVISLLVNFSIQLNIYGILTGILWALANSISLFAVLNLGLSKAASIIASLVILVSYLWGVLIFGELPSGKFFGFFGIGFIILGVVFVTMTGKLQSKNTKKGIIAAILAGLVFGSQFVPIKFGNINPFDYFFSMSLGIFLSAMTISFFRKVKFENIAVKESILSGVIWNIGNLFGVISISIIGLAKGLPITQMAVLIAVSWGLFYFKEITKTRQKIQVLLGALILLCGVVILGMA